MELNPVAGFPGMIKRHGKFMIQLGQFCKYLNKVVGNYSI